MPEQQLILLYRLQRASRRTHVHVPRVRVDHVADGLTAPHATSKTDTEDRVRPVAGFELEPGCL